MKTKITAQEAWAIIDKNVRPLGSMRVDVAKARSMVSVCSVLAPISLPPFDNSAVDGYALGKEAAAATNFELRGTIGAGQTLAHALSENEACRIMTGAKIPAGTIAVAMQEHVRVDGSNVIIEQAVREAEHIRRKGEDVGAKAIVLPQGKPVGSADIGLLCALGIHELEVHRAPSVAIVSTGNELVQPGQALGDGQVYYCTGPMLEALCVEAKATVQSVLKIDDDEPAIVSALKQGSNADILIMVGGMADGKYDFGRRTFDKIGVEPLFFEGQWRPGKPLFFGRVNDSLVFGLPGNPVAAFVMFKVFIEPAIGKMRGGSGQLPWKKAIASFKQPETSGRSLFLRGRVNHNAVELLQGQGSHQLFSLAQSNAIVWINPGQTFENEVEYLSLEP